MAFDREQMKAKAAFTQINPNGLGDRTDVVLTTAKKAARISKIILDKFWWKAYKRIIIGKFQNACKT